MKINILKSVVISCLFVVFQGAAPETAGGIDYDMVFVEGGIFRMGASAEQGDAIDCDEKPLHVVSVKNLTQIYSGFSLTSNIAGATIETIGVKP